MAVTMPDDNELRRIGEETLDTFLDTVFPYFATDYFILNKPLLLIRSISMALNATFLHGLQVAGVLIIHYGTQPTPIHSSLMISTTTLTSYFFTQQTFWRL